MSKHVARFRLFDAVATLTSAATIYSDAITFRSTTGYAALRVMSVSAGGGTATISFEVSPNGIEWSAPVDTAGNALGAIYTSLAATGANPPTVAAPAAWIVFAPQLAPYLRIKIAGGVADTTSLTVDVMFQEDATH